MADRWNYTHDDAVHGPVSGAELRGLVEKGGLAPADLIWPEGGDRRQAIRADAALAFPAPVPLAAPVSVSAPSQATDWLAGLAAAVATGGDLAALPPPPAAAWLSDVRRIEQPPGRGAVALAGTKPAAADPPHPTEVVEALPAAWPLSQDYNEAIQSPASNFADADLKRGRDVRRPPGHPDAPFRQLRRRVSGPLPRRLALGRQVLHAGGARGCASVTGPSADASAASGCPSWWISPIWNRAFAWPAGGIPC